MHLTKLLLILLFFTLPLVHGNLLPTLGIHFSLSVSGNFEFTKVMFFNILSGLIFLSFFGERVHKLYLAPFSPWGKGWDSGITWRTFGIGGFFLILFLSTLFSTSSFISLIGDTEKWHTALMYLNLLGLFFILKSLEKSFLQKLIFTSIFSGICFSILVIKEFFLPSFDYGDLANRALWSFGHPNYLAGYLLLVLPFVLCQKCSLFPLDLRERIQVWVMFPLILLTLLLSKSIVALFLALWYIIYTLLSALSPCRRQVKEGVLARLSWSWSVVELERGIAWSQKNWKKSIVAIIFLWVFSFISLILLIFYFPEKLHSFLSRFYLWETTLRIIFSDVKIFFIWAGAETLPYFFDSFKVPEVYIYENFWYTADRAHNFFLDIWFQFGIFWVFLFLYLIFSLCKMEYPKGEGFCSLVSSTKEEGLFSSSTKISLLLFLLFGIFHYFSISSYVVWVLILSISTPDTSIQLSPARGKSKLQNVVSPLLAGEDRERSCVETAWDRSVLWFFLLLMTLISLTGSYFSLQLYRAELAFASWNTKLAQEIFSHPKYLIELWEYKQAQKLEWILSSQNLKEQILTEPERLQNCDTLTWVFPSVEHHFYCGDIFWKLWKQDIAKKYYRQGLQKLPDLWESDSAYWQQYFVHKSITGHRFFSPKFSDISEILQKLEIPIKWKK